MEKRQTKPRHFMATTRTAGEAQVTPVRINPGTNSWESERVGESGQQREGTGRGKIWRGGIMKRAVI